MYPKILLKMPDKYKNTLNIYYAGIGKNVKGLEGVSEAPSLILSTTWFPGVVLVLLIRYY